MSAEKRLSDLFHGLYDPMTTETLEAQKATLVEILEVERAGGRWTIANAEPTFVGPAVRQQLAVIESILAGREKKH